MAVLEIGSSSSHCGSCSLNGRPSDAKMSEAGHYTLLGYGPDNGQPGCGETWDRVIFPYVLDGKRSMIIANFKDYYPALAEIPDENWMIWTTEG